jgi:hypothetical protein
MQEAKGLHEGDSKTDLDTLAWYIYIMGKVRMYAYVWYVAT